MSKHIFADQIKMLTAFQQTVGTINMDQATLYLRCMVEETCETLAAANPAQAPSIKVMAEILTKFAVMTSEASPVDILDGIIDVLVVTTNLGHSLDLPLEEGWDEVFGSNMAKVHPTTGYVTKDEYGKVQKPDGWKKPDLGRVIVDMMHKPKCQDEIIETTGLAQVAEPAAEDPELIAGISLSDRFLNMALIDLGSCVTTIGNFRQRRVQAGDGYMEVGLGLSRVISALLGQPWVPPVDSRERTELAELKAAVAKVNSINKAEERPGDDIATKNRFDGYNLALEEIRLILKPVRKSGS